MARLYGNGTFRKTNDRGASIDAEQLGRVSGNRTERTNDQPALVATLDLCRDYILWKDEIE
jgi:hypothetical protein